MKNNTNQVLVTASGNFLVKIAGNPNAFIYITPQGHYLASKYEKVQGCANNHIEWGALIKNSQQEPKIATPEQVTMALAAIEKRKGLLEITNVAGRMQWIENNRSPKAVVVKTIVRSITTAPKADAKTEKLLKQQQWLDKRKKTA